jgi:hypothetical protein
MHSVWPVKRDDRFFIGVFHNFRVLRVSKYYTSEQQVRLDIKAMSDADKKNKYMIAVNAAKKGAS